MCSFNYVFNTRKYVQVHPHFYNVLKKGCSEWVISSTIRVIVYQDTPAVSCSADGPRLSGVKMGLGLTGKPGHAWVGAWHDALVVVVWIMCRGDFTS